MAHETFKPYRFSFDGEYIKIFDKDNKEVPQVQIPICVFNQIAEEVYGIKVRTSV